jgi:hypothetical protein
MSRTVGYELDRFNKAFTPSMDAPATTGSADLTGVRTIVWNRFRSARSPSMKTGCVTVVVGLHEVAADRFKSARSGVTDCACAVLGSHSAPMNPASAIARIFFEDIALPSVLSIDK